MFLPSNLMDILASQMGNAVPRLNQQRQSPQMPAFNAYGPYGLLAAQMAQRPTQAPTQGFGLLGGGMPPSKIPSLPMYRPVGK